MVRDRAGKKFAARPWRTLRAHTFWTFCYRQQGAPDKHASNSYGEDRLEGERGDRGAEGRADCGNEEERAYTREGARRLGN